MGALCSRRREHGGSRGRGTVKGRVAESQTLKLTLQAVGE